MQCLPAPRQVSESKLTSVLGRTHEVLSGACATSLVTPKVFFLQVEQSRHPTLPSGRHNPRRSAIPQGRPCGMASFIQDRATLLNHNLTNLPPTGGEICLQVFDHMVAKKHFLFSTDNHHPQSIKTLERLRRES